MDKFSPTIENYLNLLYVMERDKEPPVGTLLAEILGVSPPTITNTLKRMARDGLVKIGPGHLPHLTPAGWEAARSIMRRHMLAEWMLSKYLTWSKVHAEAHRFEHAISPELENALIHDLHSPSLCPHGNPLPGYEDAVVEWVPLISIHQGGEGIIRRIHELAEDTPQVLDFLEEKSVMPGEHIKVLENLSFNKTVTVEVKSKKFTIGYTMARFIFLEPV
ncbi:MAG: metal-dependent transcriptional regulator [Leptolinea sp.]|jgi:DtxR family Mn-dependent transcriptional regulator|nr:metal-dependent transcriptional regulator [Leptolinea sp.]